MKARRRRLEKTRKIRSKAIPAGTLIGEIKELIPKMRNMFSMFEPTIFPIEMPISFLIAATMDVINSGREVPAAMTVADIKNSLMPSYLAMFTAEPTVILPPIKSAARPPKSMRAIAILECLWISVTTSLEVFISWNT